MGNKVPLFSHVRHINHKKYAVKGEVWRVWTRSLIESLIIAPNKIGVFAS